MNLQAKRTRIEELLIERAMKDADFRARLISDPGDVLEDELGFRIPGHIRLVVVEEDPNTYYLVLPVSQAGDAESELTEADLKLVTGGNDPQYTEHNWKPNWWK